LKVHHLNCGSFCPHAPILNEITHCHCLLIEDKNQLILIDTGIGKRSSNILMEAQASIAGVKHDQFLSAKEQIVELGFKTEDVRQILVTHLDYDHSAGHSGFAIEQTDTKPLFHVGDAYFNQIELKGGFKSLQYQAFARLNCDNNKERVQNLKKVKQLSKNKKAVVFSSHDPNDFNKFF